MSSLRSLHQPNIETVVQLRAARAGLGRRSRTRLQGHSVFDRAADASAALSVCWLLAKALESNEASASSPVVQVAFHRPHL